MSVKRTGKVGYSLTDPLIDLAPQPIKAQRAPGTTDSAEIGTVWINILTGDTYILGRIANGESTWNALAGADADALFNSITVDNGITGTNGPVDLTSATTIDTTSTGITSITSNAAAPNAININSPAGGITLDSILASHFTVTGAQDITVSSVGGSVVIDGGEDVSDAVQIIASHVIGGVTISSGTGGIVFDSDGLFTSNADTDTQAGVAATINANIGVATLTGNATAINTELIVTITCDKVTATSGILVSASNTGANDARMTVYRVFPDNGSFVVTLWNNGAAALNGDVIISFIVLN